MGSWVQVYDLAQDREYIERLQTATVEATEHALCREHGLVGTESWWEAIGEKKIPSVDRTGRIARVYVNASNWPEFEMECDGERSTWALEGEVTHYKVGSGIRIRWVMLPLAKPASDRDREAQVVTGIWIED